MSGSPVTHLLQEIFELRATSGEISYNAINRFYLSTFIDKARPTQ